MPIAARIIRYVNITTIVALLYMPTQYRCSAIAYGVDYLVLLWCEYVIFAIRFLMHTKHIAKLSFALVLRDLMIAHD